MKSSLACGDISFVQLHYPPACQHRNIGMRYSAQEDGCMFIVVLKQVLTQDFPLSRNKTDFRQHDGASIR
jgi:hypothetical protein